ncbi:hypothetical protein M758_UG308700 [Ceratodon purpureus]|nr:hypothetical protein M758_UG308700 [Ceratodon purpureus]
MHSAVAVTIEMTAAGLPMNNYIYNILLDGCAQRGDMWEASDIMQKMRQEGLSTLDVHSYTSFVNACCKARDMQVTSEDRIFNLMLKLGGGGNRLDKVELVVFVV